MHSELKSDSIEIESIHVELRHTAPISRGTPCPDVGRQRSRFYNFGFPAVFNGPLERVFMQAVKSVRA